MSLYFSQKYSFAADPLQISSAMEQLQKDLTLLKIPTKAITKFCLQGEEILSLLIKNADGKSNVTISLTNILGTTKVKMSCSGSSFTLQDMHEDLLKDFTDAEERFVLQNLLSKVLTDQLQMRNKNGVNTCQFLVQQSSAASVYTVIGTMLGGLICGCLFKELAPIPVITYLIANILEPIATIFINLLKTVIGPLVFFSIAGAIANFTDLKALGRVAFKTLGLYFFTSVVAIIMGYLACQILPAGDPSLQAAFNTAEVAAPVTQTETTLGQSLIALFPFNIIDTFLRMDMLQIIIIAGITGIACSKAAEQDTLFVKIINSTNTILTNFIGIIVAAMPLVIFSSMMQIVLTTDFTTMLKMLSYVFCNYLGYFLVFCCYAVMLFLTGCNPKHFFQNFMPAIITAFATSSSNATIPVSLKQCTEKIGISPKIASFSIPLGATINMNGCCTFMVISLFFIAKIMNIEIPKESYFSLAVTIYALCAGAPGVAGGILIYLAAMLPMIGAPTSAMTLIIALNAFLDRVLTPVNITGDAVVAAIVAKSENMFENKI